MAVKTAILQFQCFIANFDFGLFTYLTCRHVYLVDREASSTPCYSTQNNELIANQHDPTHFSLSIVLPSPL